MYKIDWNTGYCTAEYYRDALIVFNAMCRVFLYVKVTKDGDVVWEYDNR